MVVDGRLDSVAGHPRPIRRVGYCGGSPVIPLTEDIAVGGPLKSVPMVELEPVAGLTKIFNYAFADRRYDLLGGRYLQIIVFNPNALLS